MALSEITKPHSKVALAVLKSDFLEYTTKFDSSNIPEVLKKSEVYIYCQNGEELAALVWTSGNCPCIEGEQDIVTWFESKPHRIIILGGHVHFKEETSNVEGAERIKAFDEIFTKVTDIFRSSKCTSVGTVKDFLFSSQL